MEVQLTKSIPQRIRDAKADPKKVVLRDAGLIDAEGVITRQGRFVLRAFLLDKYEADLVTLAKAHLAEKQAETN
jgi:hypothetical protein